MLTDVAKLQVFFVAAAILLLTPGPAVLYIVARSIEHGRFAGIVSTLGIAVGTLFHVAAAAFGVSIILMTSAAAFAVLKYVGAAYLVYLGVRTILSGAGNRQTERKPTRLSAIFFQGVWVNVLNPKTALFFFAFLPQFVDVNAGRIGIQMFVLGMAFVAMGIVSDGAWALAAGTAGDWLRRHTRVLRAQRFFSGGVMIALGLVAALTSTSKD